MLPFRLQVPDLGVCDRIRFLSEDRVPGFCLFSGLGVLHVLEGDPLLPELRGSGSG